MHLVMRASSAAGHRSMLSKFNKLKVEFIVYKFASKFNVTILGYTNVGNHLHLIIKAKTKDGFKNFLRTITGLIARTILRAQKNSPKGKFWDSTAFTRVISWGRDYIETQIYLTKNRFEGEGLVLDTPTGWRRFRFNLPDHW